MVTQELKTEIMKSFFKNYKTFLKNYIYKKDDIIKEMFKTRKSEEAFKLAVLAYINSSINFYQQNPNGTYMEEQEFITNDKMVKKSFQMYQNVVPDRLLYEYLQIYMYCVEELGNVIYTNGFKVKQDIKFLSDQGLQQFTLQDYLCNSVNSAATEMYRRVSKDVKSRNLWWLKNTATTLRRQLFDNFTYVNTARFKLMCKKYLEMDMTDEDIQQKFTQAKNGGIKLGIKLDKIMLEKHNAKPYHCWWEVTDEGKHILHLADYPPHMGVYTYVAYHTSVDSKNQQRDTYFL